MNDFSDDEWDGYTEELHRETFARDQEACALCGALVGGGPEPDLCPDCNRWAQRVTAEIDAKYDPPPF